VAREDPKRLVGYLGRTGVLEARQRQLIEEETREQSWPLRGRPRPDGARGVAAASGPPKA
jgi:hypothetical protein